MSLHFRENKLLFDLEKFTNVNGKTGIYAQYSQVRAKKLLENIETKHSELSDLILNDVDKKQRNEAAMKALSLVGFRGLCIRVRSKFKQLYKSD